MIIDPLTVLQAVPAGQYLVGLADRELTNPEGAGFDLRLDVLHTLTTDASLGIDQRRTSDVEVVHPKDGVFTLLPGEYYLATTIEEVRPPSDVAALVIARSTLYRSGLILSAGLVAPGYGGTITVGLFNAGSYSCTIERGARFIHLIFMSLAGRASTYRGQWQGGRIAAPESEEQV